MMNGFKVVDGDGHMLEPLDIWENYVEPEYHDRIPKVSGHVGRSIFAYDPCEAYPDGWKPPRPESMFADFPDRYGEAYESWWSLKSRLDHMDQEGIDVSVVFATNGETSTTKTLTDPALQAALCRAYNNWSTDYCSDSGGRVKFIAKVTMLDIDLAVQEIERIAGRTEPVGVQLADPGDRLWNHADFDPLWAKLCEHGFPACFHGINSQLYWMKAWTEGGLAAVSHSMGFPLDAMLAVGTVIFGGVLERFPELKAGFYEANAGWLPWWLGRLDDHSVGRQDMFTYGKKLRLTPTEYFMRQCFLAADADEPTLETVIGQTDGQHILFNTDYPHPDAAFPGAVETFLDRPIADDAKRRILWDNAVEIYGDRLTAK
jgi:predicted TIM-barrel fold metal-dependent hydrolase